MIFNTKDHSWTPMHFNEGLYGACLPISRHRVIWGFKYPQHKLPDVNALNRAFAECSCEFFLSSIEDDFSEFHNLIGARQSDYVKATSNEISGDLIRTMTTPESLAELIQKK